MGFFDFLKQPDINQGVLEFRNTEGAVLLDVRTPQEYREGHIPGSENIPLQQLDEVDWVTDDMDTVLYVYCQSGSRSRQAAALLRQMGYTNVRNIGGIRSYDAALDVQTMARGMKR